MCLPSLNCIYGTFNINMYYLEKRIDSIYIVVFLIYISLCFSQEEYGVLAVGDVVIGNGPWDTPVYFHFTPDTGTHVVNIWEIIKHHLCIVVMGYHLTLNTLKWVTRDLCTVELHLTSKTLKWRTLHTLHILVPEEEDFHRKVFKY